MQEGLLYGIVFNVGLNLFAEIRCFPFQHVHVIRASQSQVVIAKASFSINAKLILCGLKFVKYLHESPSNASLTSTGVRHTSSQ